MEEPQPQSDEVLQEFRQQQQQASRRGKLKIFFGYVAGVGKTFSMLEAARAQAVAGVEVVLGYVEPHARPETEALTLGLELLPSQMVEYRDIKLREFDLDGALKRKPFLLIVDELAHTNAPGLRHTKRWQDVEELLEAGINVYTTLNVQHLESLNDVVAQISGIQVRETIPDSVFDQADSIELVDLPPEELLQRFREGKVYVPAQSERAMSNFFKLPNLFALRELALRRTADRVNAQTQTARGPLGKSQIWATSERLLVCVGPSPTSARIIRIAKRMTSSLRAPWVTVYVESPSVPMGDATRQRLAQNLRLAEELGAQTAILSGDDIAEEIVKYAHAHNVTKIVIGKTGEPRWREILGRSIVSRVLHLSGDIDVYVIRGKDEEPAASQPPSAKPRIEYSLYLRALIVSALCTAVAWAMTLARLSETNCVMVYFLGVAFVAAWHGRGPAILASFLCVLSFDYFSVRPYFSFAVDDAQYLITFVVMLAIAILISNMAHRIRKQAEASRQRERSTQALYRLSRTLAGTSGIHQLASAAEIQLSEILASEVAIFLPDDTGKLGATVGGPSSFAANAREIAVAQWTHEHGRMAGIGTDTLPNASALYVPLKSAKGTVGVLAVRPIELGRFAAIEERRRLEILASQVALAIERDRLAQEAQKILVQVEAERLRSSLLSSVSHDLRTPLAVIAGASSSLLEGDVAVSEPMRRELLQTICDESARMAALVDNLLNITRLESGAVSMNKQWHSVEEIVGSALARAKRLLGGREISTHVPQDLPLVSLDGVLIEQVLINLLENASRYTPEGSPIDISARVEDHHVAVEVADRGPGLTEAERQQVFDKFYRGSAAAAKGHRGAGLGLAICKAVIQAHGGTIWTENRPGGGARFILRIPQEGQPPSVSMADQAEDA